MKGGAGGLVALAAALLMAAPAQAVQEVPDPLVRVAFVASDPLLRVVVAPGWYLYGPEPGDAGLPLTLVDAADGTDRTAAARWPRPDTIQVAGGPLAVYRGSFEVGLPTRPVRDIELRWAACRGDLCVPGVTRVKGGTELSSAREGAEDLTPAVRPSSPVARAGVR